jgi:hypothetical protein
MTAHNAPRSDADMQVPVQLSNGARLRMSTLREQPCAQ